MCLRKPLGRSKKGRIRRMPGLFWNGAACFYVLPPPCNENERRSDVENRRKLAIGTYLVCSFLDQKLGITSFCFCFQELPGSSRFLWKPHRSTIKISTLLSALSISKFIILDFEIRRNSSTVQQPCHGVVDTERTFIRNLSVRRLGLFLETIISRGGLVKQRGRRSEDKPRCLCSPPRRSPRPI